MSRGVNIIQYYDCNADKLIDRYRSIEFQDVHSTFIQLLPKCQLSILDVGAGIGRDSLSLSRMGHVVTASEPSKCLRQYGERYTKLSDVRWVDDSLPLLDKIRKEGLKFDVILVSAVWMHLDKKSRSKSLDVLKSMLFDNGFIYITYRSKANDCNGIYYNITVSDFKQEVISAGLVVDEEFQSKDKEEREGVWWYMFVIRKKAKS
jgi:2-polyprenyl-3-methyl-5-hydroxy-6-metoxy-1,4-benzoquinol methylase